ncbi:MAG: alpha/beta hydrolase [Lachnospiraceae bacterium]|nr:alpha/beta hydrolase [Lachnospiraceae bacterium]
MKFNQTNYTIENVSVAGKTLRYRSFKNLIYVDRPVCAQYQQMNIYVPEAYYEDLSVNGYMADTAPVFVPNYVGGYRPGEIVEPGSHEKNGIIEPNTVFQALYHGYVVAVPALRGRTLKDSEGMNIGKAPAAIVDYKAAVRFLRHYAEKFPGDKDKIITSGSSAGGALSALMGATGNHPDYVSELEALGAAVERDDVLAASCYCPITNLDHADSAYEWQFYGVNSYYRRRLNVLDHTYSDEEGKLSDFQIQVSGEERTQFPDYVNSLNLKGLDGKALTLETDGEGSFKEYIKDLVKESAQAALDNGENIEDKKWLVVCEGRVESVDFGGFVRDITRMKLPPAFDGLDLDNYENDLFGDAEHDCCHFTQYSADHSVCGGITAEYDAIKMMNPMYYIDDPDTKITKYWRIRHGECDRDTSLAVSAILAIKLQMAGNQVDYCIPWEIKHDGDYDLPELFEWIDGICRV